MSTKLKMFEVDGDFVVAEDTLRAIVLLMEKQGEIRELEPDALIDFDLGDAQDRNWTVQDWIDKHFTEPQVIKEGVD